MSYPQTALDIGKAVESLIYGGAKARTNDKIDDFIGLLFAFDHDIESVVQELRSKKAPYTGAKNALQFAQAQTSQNVGNAITQSIWNALKEAQ